MRILTLYLRNSKCFT